MIRQLFFWAILIITCVLVYNRYFGDTAEKEQSKKVFGEAKELFHSVTDVVKSEKQKFESGKYDQAVGNIRNLFGKMRESAEDNKDVLDQIDELEQKRKEIEEKISKIKEMPEDKNPASSKNREPSSTNKPLSRSRETDQLKTDMDNLLKETKELMNKIEKEQ
ncbi:MAG: hypothetical protein ACOYOA_09935 [Saprospiraceae bacterium]